MLPGHHLLDLKVRFSEKFFVSTLSFFIHHNIHIHKLHLQTKKWYNKTTHTKTKSCCSSQQIGYIEHAEGEKVFWIFVIKICEKGFSQDESETNLGFDNPKIHIFRKPLLPNNKTQTSSFSLIVRISGLLALRSSKIVFCWLEKFWQHMKKW